MAGMAHKGTCRADRVHRQGTQDTWMAGMVHKGTCRAGRVHRQGTQDTWMAGRVHKGTCRAGREGIGTKYEWQARYLGHVPGRQGTLDPCKASGFRNSSYNVDKNSPRRVLLPHIHTISTTIFLFSSKYSCQKNMKHTSYLYNISQLGLFVNLCKGIPFLYSFCKY